MNQFCHFKFVFTALKVVIRSFILKSDQQYKACFEFFLEAFTSCHSVMTICYLCRQSKVMVVTEELLRFLAAVAR